MSSTLPSLTPIPWRRGSDLARAIRTARERLGLSHARLAARARVTRAYVYQLEAGKDSARSDKVLAVLAALGIQAVLISTAPPR